MPRRKRCSSGCTRTGQSKHPVAERDFLGDSHCHRQRPGDLRQRGEIGLSSHPRQILLGRHQGQAFVASPRNQLRRVGGAVAMVIRKRNGCANFDSGSPQRGKEFLRIANPCECQHPLALQPIGRAARSGSSRRRELPAGHTPAPRPQPSRQLHLHPAPAAPGPAPFARPEAPAAAPPETPGSCRRRARRRPRSATGPCAEARVLEAVVHHDSIGTNRTRGCRSGDAIPRYHRSSARVPIAAARRRRRPQRVPLHRSAQAPLRGRHSRGSARQACARPPVVSPPPPARLASCRLRRA